MSSLVPTLCVGTRKGVVAETFPHSLAVRRNDVYFLTQYSVLSTQYFYLNNRKPLSFQHPGQPDQRQADQRRRVGGVY